MGLRTKILFGFTILVLMLFVAGIWSIHELNLIGNSVQKLLDENYKSINAARMMIEALEREDSAILLLLLGRWNEGKEIISSGDSLFWEGFHIANNNLTIPGEKAYLDSIHSTYHKYKELWDKPILSTKKEGDLNWYFKEMHKAFLDAKLSVNKLMDINSEVMFQTASETRQQADRAIMPGIVAILAAIVFILVFNYFVNYYMVGPIVRITKGIKDFINKRAPFNVEIETKDELTDLAEAISILCTLDKNYVQKK